MNYGPLTLAIDRLVDLIANKPANMNDDERKALAAQRLSRWNAIQTAQDDMYKAIKTDRLICEELDREIGLK